MRYAIGFLAFAVLFTGAAVLFTRLASGEPYAPLEYVVPQTVHTPVVSVGSTVQVTGTKCNTYDEPVAVKGTSYFRKIEDGGMEYVPYRSGARTFEPGCSTRTFDSPLPDGVGPGTWVLMGVDDTFRGLERQAITWRSEPFRVIP